MTKETLADEASRHRNSKEYPRDNDRTVSQPILNLSNGRCINMRIFNNYQFIYMKSPEVRTLFLLSTVLCVCTVCARILLLLFFFFWLSAFYMFAKFCYLFCYCLVILRYRATFTNLFIFKPSIGLSLFPFRSAVRQLYVKIDLNG